MVNHQGNTMNEEEGKHGIREEEGVEAWGGRGQREGDIEPLVSSSQWPLPDQVFAMEAGAVESSTRG